MKINNIPAWALSKYYLVIRHCDGEWWFYDAWEEDEADKAMDQAWEVDGELYKVSRLTGRQ